MANELAKKYKLPFRFRMCHGRHPNLKEEFIVNCMQKEFSNVTYVPTDRSDEEFDPKKAVKFYKYACKSTKVDGKYMFNEQCDTHGQAHVRIVPQGRIVIHIFRASGSK